MNLKNYTSFFHDGSINEIKHTGNKITISMESAEMNEEDKLDDGIIADNIFAVKPVGFLADSIVVSNHDSSRIERGVQLNNW